MKRFIFLLILLVNLLPTGCATTIRYTVPAIEIEAPPPMRNIIKSPTLALILVDEDEIFKELHLMEGAGPKVNAEYTFPVGQILRSASLPIFSQFFDKVELSTNVVSPNIGTGDIIIIPEIKELNHKGAQGLVIREEDTYKASMKITVLDKNGLTLWQEVLSSPDIKMATPAFKSPSGWYKEVGTGAGKAVMAVLEQAAKEISIVVAHPEIAIENMKKRISADPVKPILYLKLFSLYMMNKQYDEAITAVKRSAELNPGLASAYYGLGYAYGMKKQYDEALNALKKASDLEPGEALYRAKAGDILVEKENYVEASEAYRKAAALQPANINRLLTLANSYRRAGRYDDALASVNQAIEMQTITGVGFGVRIDNDYPVLKGLMEEGPGKKAGLNAGDRIIKVDGNSTKDWKAEQVVQSLKGAPGTRVALTIERQDSDKPFDKFVTRETMLGKHAAASFGLRSLISKYKGDKDGAFRDAEKASSLDPANNWARISLGAACLDRGKYFEATKLLSQVKNSPPARILEATAYAKQGSMKEAANIYLAIPEEEISTKNIPLMTDRMALLEAFKPLVKEQRDMARSFESKRQQKEALSKLAEALRLADETEGRDIQETMFSMVRRNPLLSESPEDARKHIMRGEVLIKEANFGQAASELKKAIQIAPYIARLYYNYALVNAKLEKYPEAVRNLKIYLRATPDGPDARAAKDDIYKLEIMMEKRKNY